MHSLCYGGSYRLFGQYNLQDGRNELAQTDLCVVVYEKQGPKGVSEGRCQEPRLPAHSM